MAQLVTAAPQSAMVYASTLVAQTPNAALGAAGGSWTQAAENTMRDLINDLRQAMINAGLLK